MRDKVHEQASHRVAPRLWQRLHAAASRWPVAYRGGHHAALAAIPLLLLSGIALYLPAWHAPLIPYLPFIYWGHVVLGTGFGALLLLPVAFPLASRRLAGFDWAIVLVLGGGLTLTGIMLWLIDLFPAAWRGNAFSTHGLLSTLIAAWVTWHGYVRIRRLMPRARPRVAARADRDVPGAVPEPATPPVHRRVIARREFLRWAGGGLAAAFLATLGGGPLIRMWQEFGRRPYPATAGAGPAGAPAAERVGWPGFQLYTVVPGYPDIPRDRWRLTVDGMVDQPVSWSYDDFLTLPQTAETETFQCVTGWAVPDCRWQGVRLKDVLARARPAAGARYITLYSGDGAYTESLSLEQATGADVLLAHSLNGEPLPRAQGAPVRLVMPRMYGYKSIKWLTRVEVVAERELGFWEVRGYDADAWLPRAQGNASAGEH